MESKFKHAWHYTLPILPHLPRILYNEVMRKTVQATLALFILCLSLALLLWGFAPPQREIRRQPILPTEMQLPAPQGCLPFPAASLPAVWQHSPL
jgi:hypothetical protein